MMHQSSLRIFWRESVTAGADGKKIIKAGTPLTGDILKRNTAFTVGTSANAVALLLHDLDVTDGNTNGTILILRLGRKLHQKSMIFMDLAVLSICFRQRVITVQSMKIIPRIGT